MSHFAPRVFIQEILLLAILLIEQKYFIFSEYSNYVNKLKKESADFFFKSFIIYSITSNYWYITFQYLSLQFLRISI